MNDNVTSIGQGREMNTEKWNEVGDYYQFEYYFRGQTFYLLYYPDRTPAQGDVVISSKDKDIVKYSGRKADLTNQARKAMQNVLGT